MTHIRTHADEARLGLATSSKLSWLNAAWNTLLSNPFAVAADLCSAILDTKPFGHPEILPEPIRYRLAHGAHTLSVAELALLTQTKGFHDAALYLTLKMMHEHPMSQVALLQAVADHVAAHDLQTEATQLGEIIAAHLALFSASTGLREVSGYSKLAAVNRMGPDTWSDTFSQRFHEFYADSKEPKTLVLVAYASLMGFRHLCAALPHEERAYVVIHKQDAPPSEVLSVERGAQGCTVSRMTSFASVRDDIGNTNVHLIDDLIINGDTIRGVRDFLVRQGICSREQCRLGSIWGEVGD